MKIESRPVSGEDDKYIKAKIKSYKDKVNTNFQGKKTPKENSSYKCLSIITLESFIKVNKNIILKYFWMNVSMKLKIRK